jgi:hypothetical protein
MTMTLALSNEVMIVATVCFGLMWLAMLYMCWMTRVSLVSTLRKLTGGKAPWDILYGTVVSVDKFWLIWVAWTVLGVWWFSPTLPHLYSIPPRDAVLAEYESVSWDAPFGYPQHSRLNMHCQEGMIWMGQAWEDGNPRACVRQQMTVLRDGYMYVSYTGTIRRVGSLVTYDERPTNERSIRYSEIYGLLDP